MVLCGWRLLKGPEVTDRMLAMDTLYMNTVALIVMLGMRWNTPLLFEAALLVAMLGFASTVALARYVAWRRGGMMNRKVGHEHRA
jgi:multicomponent K+:H+ antiporter subunit F